MQYTQADLKEYCKDLHSQAETTQLSQDLISGTIDPNIYKTLLWQLFLITDVIETRLEFSDDTICRKYKIIDDISQLPPAVLFTCETTKKYIKHLKGLGYHAFKGHVYTHYLGWLYGGQMIAKNLMLPTNHLKFENVKDKITYIRENILTNITKEDLVEAQLAFQYTMDIYKELYELHRTG